MTMARRRCCGASRRRAPCYKSRPPASARTQIAMLDAALLKEAIRQSDLRLVHSPRLGVTGRKIPTMKIIRTGVGILLLAATVVHGQAPPAFDLIIRHGTVIDGTGNPRYDADIGIRNGYIAAIGDLAAAGAATEIEARGLFVAPGFINIHSHAVAGRAADRGQHADAGRDHRDLQRRRRRAARLEEQMTHAGRRRAGDQHRRLHRLQRGLADRGRQHRPAARRRTRSSGCAA